MRVKVQNQCERTGEQASITYVLDVQGSLGGDKRLDAGRVTATDGIFKRSPSLRSVRSSYAHSIVLAAHLVLYASWRVHYSFRVIITLFALSHKQIQ
jgi:hypothetical protein